MNHQQTSGFGITQRFLKSLAALLFVALPPQVNSAVLQAFKAEPSGERDVTVAFQLSAPVPHLEPFALEGSEPKLIIDFPSTRNGMSTNAVPVGIRFVRDIELIEAAGRTRVIINTSESASSQTRKRGRYLYITLSKRDEYSSISRAARPTTEAGNTSPSNPATSTGETKPAPPPRETLSPASSVTPNGMNTAPIVGPEISGITDIQFRRGQDGQGALIISLSDASLPFDVKEEKPNQLSVRLPRANIPVALQRRMDVVDFGTPVQTIDAFETNSGARLLINTDGPTTHLAYQTGNNYTLEIRQQSGLDEQQSEQKVDFGGERLSLNFQDIETRAVLQVIAEFTGLNIVVSDTVSGNITLRLNDVPWDQALDLVLKSQGLSMRRNGNVILVAPSDELAQQERLELESQTQLTELSPIRSEVFKVRYASVSELFNLLTGGSSGSGGGDGGDGGNGGDGGAGGSTGLSLLSPRGRIIADERTNTLIVYESADRLADIRDLIDKLDVAVRQVLIESRIVSVTDTYFKSLGARFGFAKQSASLPIDNQTAFIGGPVTGNLTLNPITGIDTGGTEGLMSSLPAAAIGTVSPAAMTILTGSTSRLVQLELSALQQDGKAETVSTPRVITADQQSARISQGVLIQTTEAASSGATTTSYTDAVLALEVTPQITPDDNVIMDLNISDDSPATTGSGNIDSSRISTNVRVPNGETLVLGGIFKKTETQTLNKVPFFGDLPVVGRLFRQNEDNSRKSELLVFITPKILPDLGK